MHIVFQNFHIKTSPCKHTQKHMPSNCIHINMFLHQTRRDISVIQGTCSFLRATFTNLFLPVARTHDVLHIAGTYNALHIERSHTFLCIFQLFYYQSEERRCEFRYHIKILSIRWKVILWLYSWPSTCSSVNPPLQFWHCYVLTFLEVLQYYVFLSIYTVMAIWEESVSSVDPIPFL